MQDATALTEDVVATRAQRITRGWLARRRLRREIRCALELQRTGTTSSLTAVLGHVAGCGDS